MKPCSTLTPLRFGGNYQISPSIAINSHTPETAGREKYSSAENVFARREQDILALPNNIQFLLESDKGANEDKLVIKFPTRPDTAATSNEVAKTIDLKQNQRIGDNYATNIDLAIDNWFGFWKSLQDKSQFDKAFPHIKITDSIFLERYQQVTHKQTAAFNQYLDILMALCRQVFAQPFPEGVTLQITPANDGKNKLYANENVSLSVTNRYGLKGQITMPPLKLKFLESNEPFDAAAFQKGLETTLTQIKRQTDAWVDLFKPGAQAQSDTQKPL